MFASIPVNTLEKFTSFGDLLRFLRRRAGLTQTELSIAVGYSTAQISRLEQNLRLPDLTTIEARFVEALGLKDEPQAVERLLDLAASVRREDAPAPGLCPYKGLEYFDEADADRFVGREVLTARLLERVLSPATGNDRGHIRFLAVVGASGSGKSSLVRAGLVPAMHWNKISSGWLIHVLTPTARPIERLAEALSGETASLADLAGLMDDLLRDQRSLHLFAKRAMKSAGDARLVLVVDQFEELFALCRLEEERAAFINNLLSAVSEAGGPLFVIITLRADFYAHCAGYPVLRAALAKQQEYIGAMNDEELRRAIVEPAARGHWEMEPGLVELLLREVGHEPGALPLLSHALLETWQRRRGHTLTLSGYASSGGVRGAIAETAETIFTDQFDHQQQTIARRIFLRLTELGDESSSRDTRRRATLDELVNKPEDGEKTRAVLKALADARLITLSEDSAEVAHEAIIREWPTLRGWLEDNREGLRLHRQLTEAAQEWVAMDRDPDLLYRGTRLAQAGEWAAGHQEDLNPLEQEFLAASNEWSERLAAEHAARQQRELQAAQKLAESESRAANRLRRRAYLLGGAFALAILLAAMAAFFGNQADRSASVAQQSALTARKSAAEAQQNASAAQNAQATAQGERDRADESARTAFARELAVQSQLNLDQDSERSVLLALESYETSPTKEGLDALHQAVLSSRVMMTLKSHSDVVWDFAFSPDGKRFASASNDNTLKMWDSATGQELFTMTGHSEGVDSVWFTPDGTQLASGSEDGTVRLWDASTGKERLTINAGSPVSSVQFGPDGTWLVAGANERQVRFWDTATGQELFALSSPDWTSSDPPWHVWCVALSRDGTRLAVALSPEDNDAWGKVEIWDVQKRQPQLTLFEADDFPSLGPMMSFSPDGSQLALARTGGEKDQPAVYDLTTGKKLYELNAIVNSISFSSDGKRLFTATGGGKATVWDAATGKALFTLLGQPRVAVAIGNSECIDDQAVEWCGTRLLTGGSGGTIKVWDITPGGRGEGLVLPGAGFAPDRDWSHITTLATSVNTPGTITTTFRRWATPAWTQAGLSQLASPDSFSLDYSGDTWAGWAGGNHWLEIGPDGTLRLFDTANPASAPTSMCCFDRSGNNDPRWAALSADGQLLAVIGHNGIVQLWDPASLKQLAPLPVSDPFSDASEMVSLSLSPDGKRLAVSTGVTRIWDLATGQVAATLSKPGVARLKPIGQGGFTIFSPDGSLIATGSCDLTVFVWDSMTSEVKARVQGQSGCVFPLALSPDGRLLATTSPDRATRIWDLATGRELLTLPMGSDGLGPASMAFSPDGKYLLASVVYDNAGDWDTRLFLVDPNDLVALAKSRLTRSFTNEECQKYLRLDQCPAGP